MENLKFTKELKENWLSALKSGKYIQGTGRLRRENSLCCLGVLDVVAGIDNIREDGISKSGYEPYENLLGRQNMLELYSTNDSYCDGKYTAVIPLIEEIPTQDEN